MLAGEEGMTAAAQLHAQVGFRGSRLPLVAAGTMYPRVHVIGMDICFHRWFLLTGRKDADLLAPFLVVWCELHCSLLESVNRVVPSDADVHPRVNARAALPHDDRSGQHE